MTIHDIFSYNGHPGPPPIPPEPGPRRPTRAERRLADEHARARREAIRDQARRDRERRREQLRAERAARRAAAAAAWRARLAAWWHRFVLVAAIVGVNAVAVIGQVEAFKGFDWPLIQAIAVAAVVESIAIYVGWHAHVALVEGDSVMRLRLTSYAIAAGVGALNYHHYAPDWVPSEKAIMFGFASLLSPWLWAMHSRHQHRAQLRAAGLIDPRAPKFSALRWLLWRAETWQALRWAVRHGEQSPSVAILGVQLEQATAEAAALAADARKDVVRAQGALIAAQSAALDAARLCPADDEPKVVRSTPECTPITPADVSAPSLPPSRDASTPETESRRAEEHPKDVRSTPESTPDDPGDVSPDVSADDSDDAADRRDEQAKRAAEKWVRDRMRAGRLPTIQDVADKYGRSRTWARARVHAVRARMTSRGYVVRPGNVVVPPADGDGAEDADETTDETAGGAS